MKSANRLWDSSSFCSPGTSHCLVFRMSPCLLEKLPIISPPHHIGHLRNYPYPRAKNRYSLILIKEVEFVHKVGSWYIVCVPVKKALGFRALSRKGEDRLNVWSIQGTSLLSYSSHQAMRVKLSNSCLQTDWLISKPVPDVPPRWKGHSFPGCWKWAKQQERDLS